MSTGDQDTASASHVEVQRALEKRAQFLAEQATSYALDAPESWYPDGHLDYDMFTGLLTDGLYNLLRPLLID